MVGVCRPAEPFDETSLALATLAQGVIVALHRHWQVLDDWVAGHPLATGAYTVADEARLTSRQVVVLSLVAQGLTSRAIGFRLHISPRTVERHLQNIYARLGVSDRVSAVRLATLAGVVASSPARRPFRLSTTRPDRSRAAGVRRTTHGDPERPVLRSEIGSWSFVRG